MIDALSTAEFWKIVEGVFIGPQNITFDCHVSSITKQLWDETVEQFYEKLKFGDFENKEETLIRDVFTTNLIDPEIPEELLKQTVEPRQALDLAKNMKREMRNQHLIQEHNMTLIQASVNEIRQTPSYRSSNRWLSNIFHK